MAKRGADTILLIRCCGSKSVWKQNAEAETRPFKETVKANQQEILQWSERLADLKRAPLRDMETIQKADVRLKELNREANELKAKIKQIKDAVYDLKAVNPHRKIEVDTRTPEELIYKIEVQGRKIAEALAKLRNKEWLPQD